MTKFQKMQDLLTKMEKFAYMMENLNTDGMNISGTA